MTADQKLDKILRDNAEMKRDLSELKKDVATIKRDVTAIKKWTQMDLADNPFKNNKSTKKEIA